MKQYISELKAGETVNSCFYVFSKKLLKKKTGEYYIKITLKDKTGDIEGFVWEQVEEVFRTLKDNSFVIIKGKVSEFNQKQKIDIHEIENIDPSQVDREDFIPESPVSPLKLLNTIRDYASQVKDFHYREILKRFLYSDKYINKLLDSPSSIEVHQAYRGGLLHHIYNMLNISKGIMETYREYIDSSLLITGIILHDIGKIKEYKLFPVISKTIEGNLLGHIAMGYEMVNREIEEIGNFPEEKKWKLLHIILSHHGTGEWGSPVIPMFPEAYFIHVIDVLDSRAQQFIKEMNINVDRIWSDYNKYLSTKVYIGSREDI